MIKLMALSRAHTSANPPLYSLIDTKKKPQIKMLQTVRKKSCTHPFIQIYTSNKWGLFWAETHPPSDVSV